MLLCVLVALNRAKPGNRTLHTCTRLISYCNTDGLKGCNRRKRSAKIVPYGGFDGSCPLRYTQANRPGPAPAPLGNPIIKSPNESMLRDALKPALIAAGTMPWSDLNGGGIEAGC